MRKTAAIGFSTIAVIIFVALLGNAAWHNNFGWAMLTHYPYQRIEGYYRFARYWQGTMRELRYDPARRVYSFAQSIDRAKQRGDALQAGLLAFHEGRLDRAIAHFEAASRSDETSRFWLAMAYLRRGMKNRCLVNRSGNLEINPDHPCRLPQTPATFAPNTDLARARKLFQQLLSDDDSNSPRYKWLLNLSVLLETGKVADVPKDWRIDSMSESAAHANAIPPIRLVERAHTLGIDTYDAGKGVAVEDFDRDGDMDIVTGGFYGPTHFYRNQNGTAFTDASKAMGLDTILGAHMITAADYDNDGWMDLFVSHPTGTHAYGAFSLLRNDRGARFVDVTYASGLLDPETMTDHAAFTWTSAWGDIDNDGDLDLFVANFGGKQLINGRPALDSTLYRNDGGQFADVSEEFGLSPYLANNLIVGAAFGDYNGDGYADLAIASMLPGFPMLFANRRGKSFTANDRIVAEDDGGFTLAFADFNHDGRLDLFRGVAMLPEDNMRGYMEAAADSYGHSAVWIQQPDGNFRLAEGFFRNGYPMASMGASFGDLNNDGAYEFYLGTGGPQPWFLLPNVMYAGTLQHHRPTERLIDITQANPVGSLAKGHGIVFFDSDGDGDQDVYSSLGGMWPGDAWPNEFFVNRTQTKNSWIKLRLRGRKANYYGLGAMLRVRAQNPEGERVERYYLMDNKTGFGSAPYLAHIGLADAVRVTEVAVKWPGTTEYQPYRAQINKLTILEQGA